MAPDLPLGVRHITQLSTNLYGRGGIVTILFLDQYDDDFVFKKFFDYGANLLSFHWAEAIWSSFHEFIRVLESNF